MSAERDAWGDLLRGVCSFVIILLHNTCNAGFVGRLPWLAINSFTAFAVPCFFMISGAYMLRREHGIKETLTKRVPKGLIPLLFWSVIYILLSGNLNPKQFILMLFQEQTPHLWFMYCILAIYMLLPLLSKLYCQIDKKMKWYLLSLLLFFPSVLYTAECILNHYVTMPRFAVFWPDLGVFLLGAVLWDCREKFEGMWKRFVALFLIGFAMTTSLSLFATLRTDSLDKIFFNLGNVGNIMMAAGFICLFICLRERLQQLPNCVKRVIHFIGEASFSIYLIHMLLLLSLNQTNFPRFFLYANEGNLIQMALSAVAYFLMCLLICWSGRQVSLFKRVF